MDFSIPQNLPVTLQNQLNEFIDDYHEGILTAKGYQTKRDKFLKKYSTFSQDGVNGNLYTSPSVNRREHEGTNRVVISGGHNYGDDSGSIISKNLQSIKRRSMLDNGKDLRSNSTRNSIYKVTSANSSSILSTPKHKKSSSLQLSLSSNGDMPFSYDPTMPLLPRFTDPKRIDSIPTILRGRYENYEKFDALIHLNDKGKETSISWGKLYLRAEKVARELMKTQMNKMDKVLLWYNKDEIIEFSVALMGCFIAGLVAVPVSFDTYSLGEVKQIIKVTNSKFILISNFCHKQLDNLQTTSNNTKIKLIKNEFFSQICFLKTQELGVYSKAKKNSPTFSIQNVSYIEFTRTPLGKLSGVVMKHSIIINQLSMLGQIIDSKALPHWKKESFIRSHQKYASTNRYTILNSLDPTRSTGLVLGLLLNIYSGNVLISINDTVMKKPGGYEGIINQYKPDVLLNDQLQLKQAAINYLEDPTTILGKKQKINFSCVKCCFTSCTTIDTDVSDMIVNKWLKNLGCTDASQCYSPILTLPDIGGIFLSVKDHLGRLENFPIHSSKLKSRDEIYVDKEKLKGNVIEASLLAIDDSSSFVTNYSKLSSFGYPIPDAILCVVNLDDCTIVPDLTVGEIWVSSNSLTDEFYQLDRVNDFVFHAKLNYPKMFSYAKGSTVDSVQAIEKLNTILNICPQSTQFLRTKLMGFVHNGKIYVLSMIEDMFLQNLLLRLPNFAHTSDMSLEKKKGATAITSNTSQISNGEKSTTRDTESIQRVVQTHYLQQITESIVRTVNTISEVSAFELNHNREEHFLVLVVESSLANTTQQVEESTLYVSKQRAEAAEKKMNDLTEQIYRILWIFHKIQPMMILIVKTNSLPRRYCSLELANSTIERKFLNGELEAAFLKCQFDNVILDFVPHSNYYNESIFSEHLSNLRRLALESEKPYSSSRNKVIEQSSEVKYIQEVFDANARMDLSKFKNIIELMEWRIENYGSDAAFNDGYNKSSSNSNENNMHKNISWKTFESIISSFLKKIVFSKVPLKRGERVVIICDNSIEYVAILLACFYCNLVVIPMESIKEESAEADILFLFNIIKNYSVKRLFIDAKLQGLLENNTVISKVWKKYKALSPKITVFSKIKVSKDNSLKYYKKIIQTKFHIKAGGNMAACLVWIDKSNETTQNIHTVMNHSTLMNSCKILKESLQVTGSSVLFSMCNYTHGIGFITSCLLGIYSGCYTSYFNICDVSINAKNFLVGLQNLNVKDLFLTIESLHVIMEQATSILEESKAPLTNASARKQQKIANSITFDETFLKNVRNIMIPFDGRPKYQTLELIYKKFPKIKVSPNQVSYVYQNKFNPMITMRSYLGLPPVDLFLDASALREGLINEIDILDRGSTNVVRLQDSGIVPNCTNIVIVNPETKQPCLNGEFGEIWCCSEANAYDYFMSAPVADKREKNRLSKDPLITEQFKSRLSSTAGNGLTYLRTGDLGFIKKVSCVTSKGDKIEYNLLYVLDSIKYTIDVLGLTHFVLDLEQTVNNSHPSVTNCIITKSGGLLSCLIKTKSKSCFHANLTALVASELLSKHGLILDFCVFVRPTLNSKLMLSHWSENREKIINSWFQQELEIETSYGLNFGENTSMYLLSDFERKH